MRRIAQALPLLAVLVFGVYLWRLSAAHDQLRADTVTQAGQRAMQLADAKAGEVEWLLSGADVLLRQFRDQYASGNLQAVNATIRSGLSAFPKGAIVHFSVIDAKGYIEFSTLNVPDRVYVGDRDYFKRHAASQADALFINKPINGRTTNGWVALLTRPIVNAGHVTGVAVLSLSPHFISEALSHLVVGPDDVVTLAFDDGTFAPVNGFMRMVRKGILAEAGPKGNPTAYVSAGNAVMESLLALTDRSYVALGTCTELASCSIEPSPKRTADGNSPTSRRGRALLTR